MAKTFLMQITEVCEGSKIPVYGFLSSAMQATISKHNSACDTLAQEWRRFVDHAATVLGQIRPGITFTECRKAEEHLFNLASERMKTESQLRADLPLLVSRAAREIETSINDAIDEASKVERAQVKQILKLNQLKLESVEPSLILRFEAQARQTGPYRAAAAAIDERREALNSIHQLPSRVEALVEQRSLNWSASVKRRMLVLPQLDPLPTP
jgi:hypothetical protein